MLLKLPTSRLPAKHKSTSLFSYVQATLIAMLLNCILCLMSPLLITFCSVSFSAAQKCYIWFSSLLIFVYVLYTVGYALFFS
jgi:hypothetical protein